MQEQVKTRLTKYKSLISIKLLLLCKRPAVSAINTSIPLARALSKASKITDLQGEGKKVMLAAGDTFRAAATEQLQIWGERNDIHQNHIR
jgi:hypothetical protein